MTEFKKHWLEVQTEFGTVLVWADQEDDRVDIHAQAYSRTLGASVDATAMMTLAEDAEVDLFDLLEKYHLKAVEQLIDFVKAALGDG